MGEFRQAFLRLIGAHRFLPSRIPHLSLRLKVSVPGVVGAVSQDGVDDLPVFNEADDPHGSPTPFDRLRTGFRTGQRIDFPRSSRGQAPVFWINRARFFRYSFEYFSASRMQETLSPSVSFHFPREIPRNAGRY